MLRLQRENRANIIQHPHTISLSCESRRPLFYRSLPILCCALEKLVMSVQERNFAVVEKRALAFLPEIKPEAIEQALMCGDLQEMSPEVRVAYYLGMCQSAGLNPMTRPFIAIKGDDGKIILYPDKGCGEQLRKINRVSTKTLSRERTPDGLYIVTVLASTPDGREEESQGIVPIWKAKGDWRTNEKSGKRYFQEATDAQGNPVMVPLNGEALANALMRAETKAKRRATLALCGLGLEMPEDGQLVNFDMRTGALEAEPSRGEVIDGEVIATTATTIARGTQAAEELFPGSGQTMTANIPLYFNAIDAAHRTAGQDARFITAYWAKMCKRFQVATRGALPAETQRALLAEVQAYYAKQQAEAQAALDTDTPPDPEPTTSVNDWRAMLADVVVSLDDLAVAKEAMALLDAPDTPEEVGDAMLARVLILLEAQEAQEGAPF